MIGELEREAASRIAPLATAGTTAEAQAFIDGHDVRVRARVARNASVQFGHTCDGVRIERRTLLMLLCPEGDCERSRAVRGRWAQVCSTEASTPRGREPRVPSFVPRIEPLATEVPVVVAGRVAVARPARFACVSPCPLGAHEPVLMQKAGWDLFVDARCVAGGVVPGPREGTTRPRFVTLREAAAWMTAAPAAGNPRIT